MTKVALVSTKDRRKAVGQSIDLLGVKSFHDRSVVLKPNFNTADPAPGSQRHAGVPGSGTSADEGQADHPR
jgi:uncharacterized protein (DUF362 family)